MPGTAGDDPAFDAAIFDLDGLLVDSEPLWLRAEVEILGGLGVPLAATSCRRTKGMFVGEVTRYWYERYPWSGPDPDEVAAAVVDRVIELVTTEGRLQPGAHRAIDLCRSHGAALAVASSSQYRLIRRVLDHFGLTGELPVVHSAEEERCGKPHPAVFLTAAAKLGAAPARCLVWEDAPAGVLAAKAARMACVAVPEPVERGASAFAIADAVLDSLEQADEALWARVSSAHAADPMAAPGAGAPGGHRPGGDRPGGDRPGGDGPGGDGPGGDGPAGHEQGEGEAVTLDGDRGWVEAGGRDRTTRGGRRT